MGRFRRLLHQVAKPAAMVGVVGLLSLSLIVTTPSNAYAFKTPMPVTPTFVMGAVKTVAPVAMAAVSVTPIGWGLRIFQLAMLAYETQDMWIPFVTGLFGESTADTQAGGYARPIPGVKTSAITPGASGVTYRVNNNTGATQAWYGRVYMQCKNTSTGVVAAVTSLAIGSSTSAGGYYPGSYNCAAGQTPVGAAVAGDCAYVAPGGTPCTAASTPKVGPENVVTWGTLGTSGFDPRGNDIGYVGKSECIDSAGTKSWVTGPEVPGDNGAMLMPSCEKAGKGHGTGRTTVTAFKPDGTQTTVWDTGAQPLSDPATPLCDPGRATSGCVMEVLKDDKPCVPGDVECENWQEESGKDPTRWKCKFGPYTLPLSQCNLLARAYSPNGSPVNDENTDADPATNSNAGPDGNPAPAPAPVVAGPTTGTAPTPGGSGQTAPSADSKARQCFPTGWAAFNPVEWVLKPVRCAFEPSKDTSQMQRTFRDKLQMKAPASWIMATTNIQGPGGGGCPNWVVTVGSFSQNPICSSSFTAAILGIRGPLFGLVATAMVWPLIRGIWYASIPVLRVTPTGGK